MYMEVSDIEIISRFKDGDTLSETKLFELFHKPLFFFIERIINNAEEANDIVVKSFIKLWERKADINDMLHAKKLLYVTARNMSFNFLRDSKQYLINDKEFFYLFDEEFFYLEIGHAEIESNLIKAITKEIDILPKKCSRIMKMIYFDGMSTLAVATKLSIAKKTVLAQKARGLSILKIKFTTLTLAL